MPWFVRAGISTQEDVESRFTSLHRDCHGPIEFWQNKGIHSFMWPSVTVGVVWTACTLAREKEKRLNRNKSNPIYIKAYIKAKLHLGPRRH